MTLLVSRTRRPGRSPARPPADQDHRVSDPAGGEAAANLSLRVAKMIILMHRHWAWWHRTAGLCYPGDGARFKFKLPGASAQITGSGSDCLGVMEPGPGDRVWESDSGAPLALSDSAIVMN